MNIWYALLVPIVISLLVYFLFRGKVLWWESLLIIAVVGLFIVIFKLSVRTSLVSDKEFWGNYVTIARYYEPWDEYVKKTCHHRIPSGKDADGNTTYIEIPYDCSYINHHPAYYAVVLNSGKEMKCDKEDYLRMKEKFNNDKYIELHRRYHSYDGDLWEAHYDGNSGRIEFIATEHRYRNYAQNSAQFYFPAVEEEAVVKFGLHDYPEITGFHKLPAIIGYPGYIRDPLADAKFDWVNGMLGQTKEVRLWVLLYKDQPERAAKLQEALWKGGNKNEFIIAIGLSQANAVDWCRVISWTEVSDLKTDVELYVERMRNLDLALLADYLYPEIQDRFVRKHFSEFKRLRVNVPLGASIAAYAIALVLSLIAAFWAVKNTFE